MKEDKNLLGGYRIDRNDINRAKQAVEEGKVSPFSDDHEDVQKIILNNLSDIEEGAGLTARFARSPSFQHQTFLLKKKYAPEIKKAALEYKEFVKNNPGISIKEANAKKNEIFASVNASYEAELQKLKDSNFEELYYKISPKLRRDKDLIHSDILLSVKHLKQFFFFGSKIHNQKLKAVSNVSFDVKKGECFGIVGESGCGKTTTGRSIIKLYKPTSGSIFYRGYRIGAGSRWNEKEIKWTRIRTKKQIKELKEELAKNLAKIDSNSPTFENDKKTLVENCNKLIAEKRDYLNKVVKNQKQKIKQIKYDQKHTPKKLMDEIQMIFQDPIDSLDPRMTVEDIIQEGLIIQGHRNRKENHEKVVEMLEKVGLVEEHASRYPHEFSGGQRQRIGIARALVMNPSLLICDEPISALDVSVRAQIINLLNDLKDEMGLTMIFIAHDLSVVKYFCDRIAVMYYGKIVEMASSDELFKNPLHPYTISLLSAIPKPNPLVEKERIRIIYDPKTVHDYSNDLPLLREVSPGHSVYCNEKEFNEYQKKIQNS